MHWQQRFPHFQKVLHIYLWPKPNSDIPNFLSPNSKTKKGQGLSYFNFCIHFYLLYAICVTLCFTWHNLDGAQMCTCLLCVGLTCLFACILQKHMQLLLDCCESLLWAKQNTITLMNTGWLSGFLSSQIFRILSPHQGHLFPVEMRAEGVRDLKQLTPGDIAHIAPC